MNENLPAIYGEGGGSPAAPVNDPVSLKSKQALEMLFVVSEGEFTSIDDIYLDDVSISNFTASWAFTYGEVNQPTIPGFNAVAVTEGVGTPIAETDVYHNVLGSFEYVDLGIEFSTLFYVNDFGDNVSGFVPFWVFTATNTTSAPYILQSTPFVYGKAVQPYSVNFRVIRPAGNDGSEEWGIMIKRVGMPADTTHNQSFSTLQYVTYYSIDNISNYPGSVLVAVRLEDANQTGGKIPTISFRGRGMKLMLPNSNYYDPNVGLYSDTTYSYRVSPTDPARAIWDGTFNMVGGMPALQYCNNLSWVIYNFLSDWLYFEVDGVRYDRGIAIPKELLAHYTFEEFARYCDEILYFQETPTSPVKAERRYTLNRQFFERKDAKIARDELLQVGNAALIEYGGLVSIVWDKRFSQQEIDSSLIFTNQNVVDGTFEYASTDITENNTQINITIQEIDNRNRTRTLSVLADELEKFLGYPIGYFRNLYGYTTSDFLMLGCSSVAAGIRKGRTLLWDSLMVDLEGDGVVQFKSIIEASVLHRGSLIRIHDSIMFNVVETGRIDSYLAVPTGIQLRLDRPITLNGVTTLIVYAASGLPIELTLAETSGEFVEVTAGYNGTLELVEQSIFIQKSERTVLYKVVNISRDSEYYTVEAVKYDARKYDFIEGVVTLPSTNGYTEATVGKAPPVSAISLQDSTPSTDLTHKKFLITWQHADLPDRTYTYRVEWAVSNGMQGVDTVYTKNYAFDQIVTTPGLTYFFTITAISSIDLPSKSVTFSFKEIRYDSTFNYDEAELYYDGYNNVQFY